MPSEPKTLNAEEIVEILARGTFDELVGVLEVRSFEAKSQTYRIDEPYGKKELAKDIAAFANSRGGIIVIGLKTERSFDHIADQVTEVHPFPKDLINRMQYYDVLKDWIHAEIENMDIR